MPTRRLTTLLACLALAAALAGCEQRTHLVRYEIGGTARSIALTYRNATGGTEQRDVAPGWALQFQTQTGAFLSLSAFNTTAGGTVRCRILVDGIEVQDATSEGGYKLASCGALAGITGATPTPRR